MIRPVSNKKCETTVFWAEWLGKTQGMLVSSLTSQVVTKSMAALTSRLYFSPFVAPSATTYISKSEHEYPSSSPSHQDKVATPIFCLSSYQPDLLLMSGQSASQVSLINGFKKQIFNRWERRQAWRWSPWALQLYCDVLIFENVVTEYISHSQMLGKVESGLPAKIWRLVGCTEMLSW